MKRCGGVLFGIGVLAAAQAFGLTVTPETDGAVLVNNILGSGITLVPGSISYTGQDTNAGGTFTGGLSAGIGIDSGIILTTGAAEFAEGPNVSDATQYQLYLDGDSMLDELIPGYTTYDAVILEFSFETVGGDLFFNYVFASEEYNEWVDSAFNDVFGFFIDGVNIALIPGTTTPVAINNVNNNSYSEYYNDNDPSDLDPVPYNIEYDGFTTVFTAVALDLGPGVHTIRLAIADAGDMILDSAVFIQGGSFSDEPTPIDVVPEPATVVLLGLGLCAGAVRRIFR